MKLKSKSTQGVVIDGQGMSPLSASTDVLRNMLYHSDEKTATSMVTSYAAHSFDKSDDGKSLNIKEQFMRDLEAQLAQDEAVLQKLYDKRKGLKRHIKSPLNADKSFTPFSKWSFYNQFMFSGLLLLIPTSMYVGAANVYSNLMASGEPVFLESPHLAIAISLVVPTGAAALKFVTNLFENQSTKKRYSLAVSGAMALSFVAWSIVFAMNFTGISGGFDFDSLGESDGGKGMWLVWLQLISEILISASLVISAEDIYQTYNPTGETENPDYKQCEKSVKATEQSLKTLKEKRANLHGEISQLKHARECFINERQSQFAAMRARVNQFNQI